MTPFRIFTMTVVLAGGTAGGAFAQGTLSLTLEDAIGRGVEEAPRLAEARARTAAATASVAGRRALRQPVVTASGGLLRTNHVDDFGVVQPNGSLEIIFPDIPTNYRLRAEVSVPLYTSGRIEALVSAAAAEERAAAADHLVLEQDVRLDVSRAYWSLVSRREAIAVLEQALARMDTWVTDVGSRVEAGFLPPNDVLSAEAARERQSVDLIRARHAAALAEILLARLIGAEPGQRIDPVSSPARPGEDGTAVGDQQVRRMIDQAFEGRAERRGLLQRAAAIRSAGDAALASLRPHVAAVAAVEPARPNSRFVPRTNEWNTAWDLGVNVSWPLWDGGRARAEQTAAAAQADALGHRLRELDVAIAIEVRTRVLALEAGHAALQAVARAVAAAAEAHRVVQERFDAGVATSTDVLDAQLVLLEVELERTQLLASQRVAEAELQRALGSADGR
jgi:outer membrane protein TolC